MKPVSLLKDLEPIVARLNRMTGSPASTYTTVDGRQRAQIGNFYLDGQYGGYALYRIVSEGGGSSDVLQVGHVSKRELQGLMFAFIAGMEFRTALPIQKETERFHALRRIFDDTEGFSEMSETDCRDALCEIQEIAGVQLGPRT
jgi:hypothetical protein